MDRHSRKVPDYLMKILVIGDAAVGKSNIMLRYTENKFDSSKEPTIGTEFFNKELNLENGKLAKLQIWDTAGQEKYRSIASTYYKGAAGVVVVYDITRKDTFENLQK